MNSSIKRIGIMTSGGDTPGMNSAIRGAVRMGLSYGDVMLGIYHGYTGLMDGKVAQLQSSDVHSITQKGGTILRTSRSEAFKTPEGQEKALRIIEAYNMDAIIVVGGDGSFRGAEALAKHGVNVMGLPGTIDNDMGYTDFTIGFDTAVNNVVAEMEKIRDTMRSHDRVAVVEVMGRNCGDIALWSALAGPADIVLTPECPKDWAEATAQLVQNKLLGRLTSLVVIAEGAGSAGDFAKYVREKTDIDIKPVVLSYIQRGGVPTVNDRMLATRLGARAVELIHEGVKNRAVGIRQNKIIDMDISEAIKAKDDFDDSLYKLQGVLNRIY